MSKERDNFVIYANVSFHLAFTILCPLVLLLLINTGSDFWIGIGLGGFIVLIFRGSFEFTRNAIVIHEKKIRC